MVMSSANFRIEIERKKKTKNPTKRIDRDACEPTNQANKREAMTKLCSAPFEIKNVVKLDVVDVRSFVYLLHTLNHYVCGSVCCCCCFSSSSSSFSIY